MILWSCNLDDLGLKVKRKSPEKSPNLDLCFRFKGLGKGGLDSEAKTI